MSDNSPDEEKSEKAPTANSMAAFSNQLDNLKDALDLLYIPYNASGRNKFREKLPFIAQYIFGEQLIKYDNEGANDPDHRIKLEEEADERRIELKITLSEIIDKSVDSGVLMSEYVGQIIDKYGVEVSQFLYADDIIERVRPNLLATMKPKKSSENNEMTEETPAIKEPEIIKEEPASPPIPPPVEVEIEEEITTAAVEMEIEPPPPPVKKIIYKDIFNLAAIGNNNG